MEYSVDSSLSLQQRTHICAVRLLIILIFKLAQAFSSWLTSQDDSCAVLERNRVQKLWGKEFFFSFFFLGIHFVFYQTRTPFHFQFSLQFDASFTQPRNQQHNARVSFHSGTSDILWAKPWHVFGLACYYFVNVLHLHPWRLSWLTSS